MAFTDDFTDTDATDLGTRTGWTLISGSEGANIRSNQLASKTTQTAYHCTDQGATADHYTQAVLTGFASYSNTIKICARLKDHDNYLCVRMAGTGSTGRRLSRKVGGLFTDLGVSDQGADNDLLKIECDGTDVSFYYDNGSGWQLRDSVTETAHQAEQRQGIDTSSHSSSNGVIDDFEAGALGGGAATRPQGPLGHPLIGAFGGPL